MTDVAHTPIAPYDGRHGWFMRNRVWTIPLGCLTAILLFAGFAISAMLIVETSFKHSDAYKQALAKALNDPRVIEQLGQPVRGGWLASGEISVHGSSGRAELRIPLSGSRRSGTLYCAAVKASGQWKFRTLQLRVTGGRDSVDLLGNATPPESQ